jgi:cell division protease FtsH
MNIFYLCCLLFPFSLNGMPLKGLKMSTEKANSILKNNYYLSKNSYNTLIDKIDNHKIKTIYFSPKLDEALSEKVEQNGELYDDYSVTTISPVVVQSIVEESVKNKVETVFLQMPQPSLVEQGFGQVFGFVNSFIFPFLFFSLLLNIFRSFQMNNMGGGNGLGGAGGGPNNIFSQKNNMNKDTEMLKKLNITLGSFAGSPEIFEECVEVVSYLKNSTLYKNAGAEIPKGILLDGPPGTGKTLLAKAIASEANANFISIAASEFVEVFVGVGALKIRNLFQNARNNKPCIIFIDEIDAVGRQRGAGINMANDEREQTLNQLLAEMDGFADNEGILVIAATNRKDVLDSALLRPGRFDRLITVPLPDKESRKKILNEYSKNKQLSQDVNMNLVSELTNGYSGAQLKNLLNEAAIFAAREGNTIISEKNIFNAIDKLLVGIVKRNDTRDDDAKKRVAIHEIGHAFLANKFNEYFDLKKVTIESTYSGAGGYTIFNEYQNITESGLYTKDLLFKRLIVTMGGKAAENIFYGEDFVSMGAVQDLKQANSLAQRMVGNFGMGKNLETFYNDNVENDRNPFLGRSMAMGDKYSDATKESFDSEAIALVDNAYLEAKKIVSENRSVVYFLVVNLLNSTYLTGHDFNRIINVKLNTSYTD